MAYRTASFMLSLGLLLGGGGWSVTAHANCPGTIGEILGPLNVLLADQCYAVNRGRFLDDGPANGRVVVKGAVRGDTEGGDVSWRVDAAQAEFYTLQFRYRLGKGRQRSMSVYVNDVFKRTLEFPAGGSDAVTEPFIVELAAGANIVELRTVGPLASASLARFDYNGVHFLRRGGSAFTTTGDVAPTRVEPRPDPYQPDCLPDSLLQTTVYRNSYYGRVDPDCERSTLADWKTANGFGPDCAASTTGPLVPAGPSVCLPNPNVANASYINAYDLGFGRDMYCHDGSQPTRTACYVNNYQRPTAAGGTPAADPDRFIATVAMERMTLTSPSVRSVVIFFAFDANGERVNQVALDSEGAKPIPDNCYACHKGYTITAAGGDGHPYGGAFLPFDVDAFDDWRDFPSRVEQEEDFRVLNQIVLEDAERHGNADIVGLIKSWYHGDEPRNTTAGYTAFRDFSDCGPDPDLLPKASWFTGSPTSWCDAGNTPADRERYLREWYLYVYGYAKYCRLCHVSQGGPGLGFYPPGTLAADAGSFDSYLQFTACDPDYYVRMPHAALTSARFENDSYPREPEDPLGGAFVPSRDLCN